jgi:hypothetical protein
MNGDEILKDIQGQVADIWGSIPDAHKTGAKLTGEMAAEFLKLAQQGVDVSEDLKDIRAQVLNWKFVGAARFQSAFWATVEKVATTLGTAALNALKASVGIP